jgi:hypothetical protein
MKNPKDDSKKSLKALPHHSSLIIHNFLVPPGRRRQEEKNCIMTSPILPAVGIQAR